MTELTQQNFGTGDSRQSESGAAADRPIRPVASLFRRRASHEQWGKKAIPPVPEAERATRHDPVDGAGGPSSRRGRLRNTRTLRHRKVRRRLRFLRSARQIAYRDIGGLVFDMRRFDTERPDLVAEKLAALAVVDSELRSLELALANRRSPGELEQAEITSCARCGALHSPTSHFCPQCGLQIAAG